MVGGLGPLSPLISHLSPLWEGQAGVSPGGDQTALAGSERGGERSVRGSQNREEESWDWTGLGGGAAMTQITSSVKPGGRQMNDLY